MKITTQRILLSYLKWELILVDVTIFFNSEYQQEVESLI